MAGDRQYVAIGLLTQRDLDVLGSGFRRAFPLDDSTAFDELLRQIDEASGGQIRDLAERKFAVTGGKRSSQSLDRT